jgi:hypothetical protein
MIVVILIGSNRRRLSRSPLLGKMMSSAIESGGAILGVSQEYTVEFYMMHKIQKQCTK